MTSNFKMDEIRFILSIEEVYETFEKQLQLGNFEKFCDCIKCQDYINLECKFPVYSVPSLEEDIYIPLDTKHLQDRFENVRDPYDCFFVEYELCQGCTSVFRLLPNQNSRMVYLRPVIGTEPHVFVIRRPDPNNFPDLFPQFAEGLENVEDSEARMKLQSDLLMYHLQEMWRPVGYV